MVDKFIGDAALLVFGLFDGTNGSQRESDAGAAAALRCALGLRDRLEQLNRRRAAESKPALAVRMAVHTGDLLAGTIGSVDRHEYTVIGDSVNVAARLNEVCKERGADLLVSRATFERAAAAGVELAASGEASVALRGRREPVTFVELARA
jgi:adenylate cyclase